MNRIKSRTSRAFLIGGAAMLSAGGCIVPTLLAAQEIVQQLPPREAGQLNTALRRLAQRPTDLDALVSAGNASLALRDIGAAAGFFARAAQVAPADQRVLLGRARVALEQRRPVEALQGFAQAEQAGVRALDMAADRALAYDLVGDNAAAQALYRSVLAVGDSAEIRMRLAISLAIAGNRGEFERILHPLLRDNDRTAFRTRAFGLAILGRPDEAVGIADAMMPTDLALRMAPYLRYMPRLTKAQQAAAANLGAFPAATEIGRDSADIAGYAAAGARIAARADTALTPAGAPLGPRTEQSTPASSAPARRRPGVVVNTPAPPPPQVAMAEPPAASPAPAPSPVAVAAQPSPPAAAAARPSLSEAFADLRTVTAPLPAKTSGAVDIATLGAARASLPAIKTPAKPDPKLAAKKAEAKKPSKPPEPARIWIQVGVGRSTDALAFDWRKLVKKAGGALDGKGPWAVKYGATNRMLAGPFANDTAARATLKRLKDKEIDALPYDSDEGEKVAKIG